MKAYVMVNIVNSFNLSSIVTFLEANGFSLKIYMDAASLKYINMII